MFLQVENCHKIRYNLMYEYTPYRGDGELDIQGERSILKDGEIMKKENIKSILVDKEDNLKSAQTLASETGAKIYELQSGLTGSEENNSYLQIMKENLEILKGI